MGMAVLLSLDACNMYRLTEHLCGNKSATGGGQDVAEWPGICILVGVVSVWPAAPEQAGLGMAIGFDLCRESKPSQEHPQ